MARTKAGAALPRPAEEFEETTTAPRDLGIEYLPAVGFEPLERPDLVGFHQPAITDDVSGQNCSELALYQAPLGLDRLRRPNRPCDTAGKNGEFTTKLVSRQIL